MTHSSIPAVDDATLDQITQSGGDTLVAEVAEMFAAARQRAFGAITEAASKRDWPALERHARSFKSRCASVAARRAARLCQSLELAACRHDSAPLDTLVADLRRALAEVEEVLEPRTDER
jgi:HPt (histidine-containing phosphotransfer) domain-containing protein